MNNKPSVFSESVNEIHLEELRRGGQQVDPAARVGTIRWKYPAFLFVFAIAIFWKLVFSSEYSMLVYTDSSFQTYPWSQYFTHVLHEGSFPFWDNYSDAGRSFIGETQTGAFYPPNILMAAFPRNAQGLLPVSVIDGFIILHCFLASLLMYGLARHLRLSPFSACVAGIVFAYGGSVGMRASAQVNLFYASIWLPAIFWSYSKSLQARGWQLQLVFANLSGLTLALSLLAGHHQPFIYSSLALAGIAITLWFAHSRQDKGEQNYCRPSLIARQTILVFLFAMAYASVQLLPSLEYSSLAYRWVDGANPSLVSARIPYSIVSTHNALPPQAVALMIFPYLFGVENSPYLGILPLLLVLFALARVKSNHIVRLAFLFVLLFGTLAMGYFSPLHGLFYALVPGFDKGREAGRIFLLAHFGLSLLAGFGCQLLCSPIAKRERTWRTRLAAGFCGFSLFICVMIFVVFFYEVQVLSKSVDYGGQGFACLLLLATSAVVWAHVSGLAKPKSLRFALVFILLFDFHLFLGAHLKLKKEFDRKSNFEPKQYYQQDDLIQFLQSQPGTFRVDFRDEYYPKNSGEVFKLDTVGGYAATSLKQFYDFQAEAYPVGNIISDLLNVRYIVSQQALDLPLVFQNKHAKVYENPGMLPRAWLVKHAVVKKDLNDIVPLLRDPSFNPRAVAYLEPMSGENVDLSEPDSTSSRAEGVPTPGAAAFARISPNRFVVETEDTASRWLVVSQNWYPGWKAWVDGRLNPIERMNGALLGVFLEPGKHRVEFSYRPTGFYWAIGLVVAALATLVFSASQIVHNLRSRLRPAVQP